MDMAEPCAIQWQGNVMQVAELAKAVTAWGRDAVAGGHGVKLG